MYEHAKSEIGLAEDEYSISVGIAGLLSGERKEAIAQMTKNPEPQDVQLGLDKLYFEYNGMGDYGIVTSISLINDSSVRIMLDEKIAQSCGISSSQLAFNFSAKIDRQSMDALKLIRSISGTNFQSIGVELD